MNNNKIIIEKYCILNPSLYLTGQKKNTYFVKEGIIIYNVKFDNISITCPCKSKKSILCNHILFILIDKLKLDFIIILFIHKLYKHIIQLMNNKCENMNESLLKIINADILNDECGICLKHITIYDLLNECSICYKYSHKSCFDKWKSYKNIERKCIYCHS